MKEKTTRKDFNKLKKKHKKTHEKQASKTGKQFYADHFYYDLVLFQKDDVKKRIPLHVRSFTITKNYLEWPIPKLVIECIIENAEELDVVIEILREEMRKSKSDTGDDQEKKQ